MKKILIIIAVILIIAVLAFLLLPTEVLYAKDGGTRVYNSHFYKLVFWQRLTEDGKYEATRLYLGEESKLSLDELWAREADNIESKFTATIIEISDTGALVEPIPGESECASADRITFSTEALPDIGAEVGSLVEITYKGGIRESYPAGIDAVGWRISKNYSHLEYTEHWLDKTEENAYGNNIFSDIVITEIWSNCFFARTVIPMPYTIKLNGAISSKWCVGDQVRCTYENTYYSHETNRVEADLISIEASNWEPEPGVDYKPVIYLYPEEPTEVAVKLDLNGNLTCTYPEYGEDGWTVTAMPNGKLIGKDGKEYNYLFWEGVTYADYSIKSGFCIRGEDTAAFLEEALAKLGLTAAEANEFIVFWLPMMQDNEYNLISFDTAAYTSAAELIVDPSPDTVIRVFMRWQASEAPVDLAAEELTAPERTGFTVVEWGGSRVG